MTDDDIDKRIKELDALIQQAEGRLEGNKDDIFLIEFMREWKAKSMALVRRKELNEMVRKRVLEELAESHQTEEIKKPFLSDDTRLMIGVFLMCSSMYVVGVFTGLNA